MGKPYVGTQQLPLAMRGSATGVPTIHPSKPYDLDLALQPMPGYARPIAPGTTTAEELATVSGDRGLDHEEALIFELGHGAVGVDLPDVKVSDDRLGGARLRGSTVEQCARRSTPSQLGLRLPDIFRVDQAAAAPAGRGRWLGSHRRRRPLLLSLIDSPQPPP